jgi:peptidoglycan/xylan/chitin deacetylase (PgdA/CDA1 family)
MAASQQPVADKESQPFRRLPILTYHSLDDSHSPVSIAPLDFRRQMEYLQANGWRTLSLDEFLAGHVCGQWPPKTFLLTFDDGFRNFVEQAYPVLRELAYTAIVFVIPDWAGATNDWPTQPGWVPRLPLLGWTDLRMLADGGVELGAHSLSHPRLTGLAIERARFEIVESQRAIQRRVGCAVQAFAYPYGACSRALEAVVASCFRAGFGSTLGFATPRNRVTRFNRVDMYYVRAPLFFRALTEDWLDVYLFMRRLLKRA